MKKLLQGFCNKFTTIKDFHWTSGTFLTIIALISGCGAHVYHVVERGETLYSISWMYGHDYRTVAQWNNIRPPYTIYSGQRLKVAALDNERTSNTTQHQAKKSVTESGGQPKAGVGKTDKPGNNHRKSVHNSGNSKPYKYAQRIKWLWPVKEGNVIQTFVAKDPGKRGIDVVGDAGQSIYSAADGQVVYSGNGLRRYGKLIIIKHNDTYLSAYAHNEALLVNEGDAIKAGQLIAKMGRTGTNRTKLHFEIRRNGRPVNPMQYLPQKMR